MAGSVYLLVAANPELDVRYGHRVGQGYYEFDTRQIRKILGLQVPLNTPDVQVWMKNNLDQGLKELVGGVET